MADTPRNGEVLADGAEVGGELDEALRYPAPSLHVPQVAIDAKDHVGKGKGKRAQASSMM